jgi:hypothetical protein
MNELRDDINPSLSLPSVFLRCMCLVQRMRKAVGFLSVISGFLRDVNEICALVECYAASSGNCLPTFRENVSGQSLKVFFLDFLTLEYGIDTLSRNVGRQHSMLRNVTEDRRSQLAFCFI